MPFNIIHGDITTLHVDAIVNAANVNLRKGGGVCGAIFRAAGSDKLQASCDKIAPIKTGDAVLTEGYDLPAKYIIHVAGPIYSDGKHGEEALLRNSYINALTCAVENGCKSIAFPLISSGSYGYPRDEAYRIATSSIEDFLVERYIDAYLVIFGKEVRDEQNIPNR
jgi:O-acetyl-ADP-ribose deacetylase (regulator of RNase III)